MGLAGAGALKAKSEANLIWAFMGLSCLFAGSWARSNWLCLAAIFVIF
jgi:hypothetical protein